MNALIFRSLPKLAFGVLLASGIAAGALAATAQPAQAGVVVSVGFGGGGYAPAYHWSRWHDRDGWHRRWVPIGWAPPVAYYPHPVYYGAPVGYGAPYAGPYYGPPAGYDRGRYDRDRYDHDRHDRDDRDDRWHRDYDHR